MMTTGPLYPKNAIGLLGDLIHQQTGNFFEDGQLDRLADKLAPLKADRDLDSWMDYYYLLKYDPEAGREWERVATALAVNETYFWREYEQIQAAAEVLVPDLLRQNPGRPVRIWHAGCATGEEPYTMAITLTMAGAYRLGQIEIVATDFNSRALVQARQGIYGPRSFRAIPAEIQARYFAPAGKDKLSLDSKILNLVSFADLNLMDSAGMSAMQSYDIIFCRNTFIYFSTAAIGEVAKHFHRALRKPGYLFIAAAESLLKVTTLFGLTDVNGAFVYKKG